MDDKDEYKRPWRVHTIGGLTDLLDCDSCIILADSKPETEALFTLICRTVNGKDFNYAS